MTQEEMQKALEAIGKSGITVQGDLVLEKKVEYEIGNVESGGIGIQINNGNKKPTEKVNDKDDHDVESATSAAMEYVGRLKDMVTPAWADHYMDLFKKIFALPQVRVSIAIVGKQQGTTFNRNMVANILQMMLQENDIFLPTANPSRMAEILENNKDHSVKAALGSVPQDKQLKEAVKTVIKESKQAL
jgi:hypothetical protein